MLLLENQEPGGFKQPPSLCGNPKECSLSVVSSSLRHGLAPVVPLEKRDAAKVAPGGNVREASGEMAPAWGES